MDAPLEGGDCVLMLLRFAETVFGPPSDVLLGVEVWRIRRPRRQKADAVSVQSCLGLRGVHDRLAIQEQLVGGAVWKRIAQKRTKVLVDHFDEVLWGCGGLHLGNATNQLRL